LFTANGHAPTGKTFSFSGRFCYGNRSLINKYIGSLPALLVGDNVNHKDGAANAGDRCGSDNLKLGARYDIENEATKGIIRRDLNESIGLPRVKTEGLHDFSLEARRPDGH
jgi:hypothetical protein